VAAIATNPCLSEDELLALAAGTLADTPSAEAHLAACPTCATLLAGALRAETTRAWDALAGTTLGPYRIDEQIGAGGMGAVYRAWDPRLGRAIAVKVLHADDASAARLAGEARAAAAIDHRAIVGIHDVGVADGIQYIAMELVDGESVRSLLRAGGLGVARARALLVELADGLAAAHDRGVVHRDLKPENLVITRGGLRILDFGLAQVADAEMQPGAVHGTAGYMAPEQARGEPADARADVFAVGAIAYELVTGRRAFPGATHAERLSATLRDTPATSELGELAPIALRCLAKEPRDRFQSAADLAWTLRAAVPGAAATATPPAPAAGGRISRRALLGGGVAALGAGALGFALGRRGRGVVAAPRPVMRPLTHRTGRVATARFTVDGNRALYGAAWDAEALAVHAVDLGASETGALDLPSADVLAISARGELALCLDRRFVDHQSARGQLALLPLAGGAAPRALADDVQEADFAPVPARSSDEAAPAGTLAAILAGPAGFRIELPLGKILVEEPGWITHARVSPDGRRVAYLRHPHVDDDSGEVMLVDVASKATRVVSQGWVSLAGVAWDPDGDAIWFTGSRRNLISNLYRVPLDGPPVNVPMPSTSRLRLHDIAADRRMLVTADDWRLRAMIGERDRSQSDISSVIDLSADGEHVLLGELGVVEAGFGAYLVPYAGGRALRIGPGFPVAISPSGQRIAANVDASDHLVIYSTSSAEMPAIAAPGFIIFARWLDERSLLARYDDKLWRLAEGAAPVEVAAGCRGAFALDPARRRCAYVDPAGALVVRDLATGETRTLATELVRTHVCGWLAAPDAVVVRSMTTPIVLDRIDAVTGERGGHLQVAPPALGLRAVDTVVIHPDGERYAYSYGQELSTLFLATLDGNERAKTDKHG
jgi:hypothetical protein